MAAAKKAAAKPAVDAPEPEAAAPAALEVDRVASVSYRADGTPDQSEGFVSLLETDQ